MVPPCQLNIPQIYNNYCNSSGYCYVNCYCLLMEQTLWYLYEFSLVHVLSVINNPLQALFLKPKDDKYMLSMITKLTQVNDLFNINICRHAIIHQAQWGVKKIYLYIKKIYIYIYYTHMKGSSAIVKKSLTIS